MADGPPNGGAAEECRELLCTGASASRLRRSDASTRDANDIALARANSGRAIESPVALGNGGGCRPGVAPWRGPILPVALAGLLADAVCLSGASAQERPGVVACGDMIRPGGGARAFATHVHVSPQARMCLDASSSGSSALSRAVLHSSWAGPSATFGKRAGCPHEPTGRLHCRGLSVRWRPIAAPTCSI